jgi:4-carboxymuconolactone decarboxylase
MARIPYPTLETMTPEQRRVHDDIVNGPRGRMGGPFFPALHNADLVDHWQKLGLVLRYNTVFPPQVSEFAILIVVRDWKCVLEWNAHSAIALKAGVSDAVVDAICAQRKPEFQDDEQREIYDFVTQLLKDKQVSDSAYNAVLKRWNVRGVVDLAALVGYYVFVASSINAHEVDLPPGAPRPF